MGGLVGGLTGLAVDSTDTPLNPPRRSVQESIRLPQSYAASGNEDKGSKLEARASVFNSFYLPPHVLAAGFTVVSECDLVRDLLFVFQGIDGAFIQYNASDKGQPGGFLLRRDVKIPKPTREMVGKLCQLGWVYKQIHELLEERQGLGLEAGLFGQALVACVQGEMLDYKRFGIAVYTRLLCVLEGHLDTHLSSGGAGFVAQDLSLKRLFVWTRGPLFRLSVVLAILQVTRGKRGGTVLSAIHTYVNHGDAGLNAYASGLISSISRPFYGMLSQWISEGVVDDPYHEFFCTTDTNAHVDSNGGSLSQEHWKSRFSFTESMIPCFIEKGLARKAFLIGTYYGADWKGNP
ncbi:Gamma-tubulin complex component 3 [Kappamyces sp. JEL0680]|nr:Gamma-tubulin complex component 3 [Kappamyces sp. JEL0680]